ncbi:MAG: hypothetical protein WDA06_00865 [Phenylobacterium sp.]
MENIIQQCLVEIFYSFVKNKKAKQYKSVCVDMLTISWQEFEILPSDYTIEARNRFYALIECQEENDGI